MMDSVRFDRNKNLEPCEFEGVRIVKHGEEFCPEWCVSYVRINEKMLKEMLKGSALVHDDGECVTVIYFDDEVVGNHQETAFWEVVTEQKKTVCGEDTLLRHKRCSSCKNPMGLTGSDYCGWCGKRMIDRGQENGG